MSESIRVLEIGDGVAGAHAARLLADSGADVVKVELPAGDPARRAGPFPDDVPDPEKSGLFLALNLNKRGVCLDLETPAGQRALTELVGWADIVIVSLAPLAASALDLDPAGLRAGRPELVVLAITPFGLTGPHADYAAEELTMAHAGGWPSICPMTHGDPDYPPLKVHGRHCQMMAGIAGAFAALALYRDARRSGVGDTIDFSIQAYVASVLEFGIHLYTYHDVVIKRTTFRSTVPWRIFEAQDGPIFIVCIEPDQWDRLVELMGTPEWTELETFKDGMGRAENHELVYVFLEEFIASWQVLDLFHAAQQYRIPIAPVMTFERLAEDPHLAERDFFVTVEGAATGPVTYMAAPVIEGPPGGGHRAPVRRPPPMLGEHTRQILEEIQPRSPAAGAGSSGLPLEGIRVVDLTWAWAGPFCSMNLAHLGADVIHIESSTRPDLYRRGGMAPEGTEPSLNTAGMFNQWNQGKRSLAVDLRSPEGREIVLGLIESSDIVVQNFATGVMDRLGLGYNDLRALNPRIIMASISGYGQSGPYREYMGYGPSTGPLSGLSSATGHVGGGPEETGVAMPDPTAGITAAWSVVCALLRRDATGEGEHLDVTLWESTSALIVEGWMDFSLNGRQPLPMGNRDPGMAPHGCYRAAGEDEWVTLACRDDHDWQQLCRLIPDIARDDRFASFEGRKQYEDDLDAAVTAWTRMRDRFAITRDLQALGVPAFPSFTTEDIIADPHLNGRGFVERLDHPEVGARAHTGIPWLLEERPNGVRSPAPCLGQHTDDVLAEVLGYGSERIAALRDAGILQ